MKHFALFAFAFLIPFGSASAVEDEVEWYTKEQIEILNREFGLNLDVVPVESPMSRGERERVEASVKEDMADMAAYAKRADRSLESLVRWTEHVLKKKGHADLAEQFVAEYRARYQMAIVEYNLGIVRADLGDHPFLWEWLAVWYNRIEGVLGEQLCKILRIYDLKVFNYAVPVVFAPRGDRRFDPLKPWGQEEYKLHFVPFGGIVGYWSVYITCVGFTFGAGALPFICSPIGMLTERVVVKRVAPPMSDRIYERFNP